MYAAWGSHWSSGGVEESECCSDETRVEAGEVTECGLCTTTPLDWYSNTDHVFTLLSSSIVVAYYYSAWRKICM